MGKQGKREFVQVLRLMEVFKIEEVTAAVRDAIARGAIGFDAVKHLTLCRIERRPPRLDMTIYPYLPARAGIAPPSVHKIWAAHGLKPHLTKTFKLSRDPGFVAKVEEIVGRYLDPPDKALVLAVDEKSQMSSRMVAAPIIAASAVSRIGLKRTAPASSSTSRSVLSCPAPCRMKSTKRIELRTMMPNTSASAPPTGGCSARRRVGGSSQQDRARVNRQVLREAVAPRGRGRKEIRTARSQPKIH